MLKLALIHYLYFLKLIVLQQSHCSALYVLVINMNLPLQLCFKCRSKVLLISLKIFQHNVTLVVCRVIMLILVYLQYTKCIFIRSVRVSNINNRQPPWSSNGLFIYHDDVRHLWLPRTTLTSFSCSQSSSQVAEE